MSAGSVPRKSPTAAFAASNLVRPSGIGWFMLPEASSTIRTLRPVSANATELSVAPTANAMAALATVPKPVFRVARIIAFS
jgi:hypothetical protein